MPILDVGDNASVLPIVLTYPPELDRQHAVLFDLCDRLRNLVSAEDPSVTPELDRGTTSALHRAVTRYAPKRVTDDVKVAAADLLKYAVEHFSYEEQLMRTVRTNLVNTGKRDLLINYEAFVAAHNAEHQAFIAMQIVTGQQHDEHRVSALALYVFVRHWLISHIGKVDRQLADWARLADGVPTQI